MLKVVGYMFYIYDMYNCNCYLLISKRDLKYIVVRYNIMYNSLSWQSCNCSSLLLSALYSSFRL